MLPAKIRYGLAVGALSLVFIWHVYLATQVPYDEVWQGVVMCLIFAILLSATITRMRKLMRVARWVCYAGLAISVVAVIVGIIGFFQSSVNMVFAIPLGIGYALMFTVGLGGIQEAKGLSPLSKTPSATENREIQIDEDEKLK